MTTMLASNKATSSATTAQDEQSGTGLFAKSEEPIFYLNYKGEICPFNVFLNGLPVYRVRNMRPVNSTRPVNTYLVNGKNEIQIQIRKAPEKYIPGLMAKGKPCTAEATLSVATKSHHEPINIATVKFTAPPDSLVYREGRDEGTTQAGYYRYRNDTFNLVESSKQGDVKVGKAKVEVGDVYYYYDREPIPHMLNVPGLTLTNDITLPMTFPEWTWEKGEPLQNDFATKEELYNEVYVPFFKALKDKDIDSLRELLAPAAEDFNTANYTDGALEGRLAALKKYVNDPDLTLYPLNPINKRLYLNVYNGKVANISFWQGDSVVSFDDKSTGGSSFFGPTYFGKIDGKWRAVF